MSSKKPLAKKAAAKPKEKQTPPQRRQSHHGLGRGLGALIGDRKPAVPVAPAPAPVPAMPTVPPGTRYVLEVPIGDIVRSPWQPRTVFDEDALNELAESIKNTGIISPLICRKRAEGGYELINGERRLRAARLAGLEKVPVLLEDAEDRKAAEMAIIENIQREELNVIEEAEGYRSLVEKFSLTQQEVADRVGKSRPGVANAMRLLALPDEVKQLVGGKLLSTGHAKVLLELSDPDEQTLLGRKCVTEALSVRALERLIARREMERNRPQKQSGSTPDLPPSYVQDLSDKLHRHFGTAVRITSGMTHANGKHSKGLLEIDFYDNDDLERILALIGVNPNAD